MAFRSRRPSSGTQAEGLSKKWRGPPHLFAVVKRKLKKIQYRPHLITGCLAATGLSIEA
jgi:hypothetical protein